MLPIEALQGASLDVGAGAFSCTALVLNQEALLALIVKC